MKLKLEYKVILLVLFSALIPVIFVSGLIVWRTGQTADQMEKKVLQLVEDTVDKVCSGVYDLCETTQHLIQERVDQGLIAAHDVLKRAGSIELSASETAEWEVVSAMTGMPRRASLPKLTIGGVWPGQNGKLDQPTPVIDEIVRINGGFASMFQIMNDAGDMLRIATNVETPAGGRAIGTYYPAINPDGSPNPIVSCVSTGGIYRGRAYVVGHWFFTAYEPLREKSGKIVGMLAVGIEQSNLTALRQKIIETKVGTDGYVYVLGGRGPQKGQYIISRDGARDGESIWETRDENGEFCIQKVIKHAIEADTAKPGSMVFETYPWKNPGENSPRIKTVAARYYAPWDWVIGASIYRDDMTAATDDVDRSIKSLVIWALSGGTAVAVLACILAALMGSRFTRPISLITDVANSIAGGNLSDASKAIEKLASDRCRQVDNGKGDEAVQLLCAIRTMTQSLNSLIGKVQQMGIQVTSSSTEIAASARQLEATVSDQSASTNEVLSTTTEITGVSKELVDVMREVGESASRTANLAGAGQSDLQKMGEGMQQLSSSTLSISARLAVIDEKTDNVKTVVTTISKVADQTNLLSLNASIEAEKAGEYGRGFSVVAREIQRLADQTAIAAMDIEKIVAEMRSAVRAGVMEMDSFSRDVGAFIEEVNRINSQQVTIIQQVQELIPSFEEVSEGVKSQSVGAEQIRDAIVRLSEGAEQTAQALGEFKHTATNLNVAAKGLQDEISRFSVSRAEQSAGHG